jgi:hypothetical protein
MDTRRGKKQIGNIDIPSEYNSYTQEEKVAVCNKILDKIMTVVDRELPPYINRMTFIDEILEETLESHIKDERYEVCSVIRDIVKLINED